MDIPYLIQILQNKIGILNNAKGQAYAAGDLDRINTIDQELLSTQNTLAQLQLLLSATQLASANDSDLATVVAAGVATAQDSALIPDDPLAVLSDYDISTYAADPLYFQKITDILQVMPVMDTATEIDAYISNEAIGSPLTGAIILGAATQYSIDTRLLMSILELESNFGTAGVAVSTLNPGNVGNTGSTTQTFGSWQDGVSAVAQWLSQHPAISLSNNQNPADATSTAATSTPTTNTASSTGTSTPAITNTTTNTATSTPATTSISQSTATSTPTGIASTTAPVASVASSTPSNTATSTSSGVASSTPSTPDPFNFASTTPSVASSTVGTASNTASSTGLGLSASPVASSTPSASTTMPISSTPVSPAPATSTVPVSSPSPVPTPTPAVDASSSPQAYRWFMGNKKGNA